MYRSGTSRTILAIAAVGALTLSVSAASDPWADAVISYDPGSESGSSYTDPATVLGSPERFTGEGIYPGAVTPFNSPWGTDEIVAIGAGGHLVVEFAEPITDDPTHRYGVDFLIFANGMFADGDWPNGMVGGLFEEGPFTVSVSNDNVNWVTLATDVYDALFPTLGYLDLTGPYDTQPGTVPSDFTRPVDPSLTYADFAGKTFAEIVALYDGSGGGIPFDISTTGLSEVRYVRIDVPVGATSPEIDAFAAVPEPGAAVLLGCLALGHALRRGR